MMCFYMERFKKQMVRLNTVNNKNINYRENFWTLKNFGRIYVQNKKYTRTHSQNSKRYNHWKHVLHALLIEKFRCYKKYWFTSLNGINNGSCIKFLFSFLSSFLFAFLAWKLNQIHFSVIFHTETSQLIYTVNQITVNQITGFYVEWNTGEKWVKGNKETSSKKTWPTYQEKLTVQTIWYKI